MNGMFTNLRENFTLKFLKKDVFELSFDFNIFYEWSNGIYDNELSYMNKENAADILDDLCAGCYEKEFEDEFRDSWIGGIKMNTIVTNVVLKLDIWE